MRMFANEWLTNEHDKLDSLAEIDQNSFWKVVNAKRSRKPEVPCKGMAFDGRVVTEATELIADWRDYFSNIYKFTEDSGSTTAIGKQLTRQ